MPGRDSSILKQLTFATVFFAALLLLQFGATYLASRRLITGLSEIHQQQHLAESVAQLRDVTDSLSNIPGKGGIPLVDSRRLFDAERDQAYLLLGEISNAASSYPEYQALLIRIRRNLTLFDQSSQHYFAKPPSPALDHELLVSKQYGIEAVESEQDLKFAVDHRSAELFTRLYALRYEPLVVAIFLTAVFVGLALYYGLAFTLRLRKSFDTLVNAAYEVSRGNLDFRAPILNRDEFGMLTRAFNLMTEELKETTVSRQYVQLLADASNLLSKSLELQTTLRNLVEIIVPRLGECCLVHVCEKEGASGNFTSLCSDPEQDVYLREALAHEELALNLEPLEAEVNSTRRPLILDSGDPRLELMPFKSLGVRSCVILPLVFGIDLLGTLAIASTRASLRYRSDHLILSEELARRASIAVENSRLYQEAQEAILMRDEFLSIASHELRTPLTSLSLNLQLLNQQFRRSMTAVSAAAGAKTEAVNIAVPGRTLQILDSAVVQSRKLAGLLDELLDLTRIRVGKLQLVRETVDLSIIVRSVVERFKLEAAQRRVPISVMAPQSLLGCWDPMRLEQVVTNLLSNALKYGNGNPILLLLEEDVVRLEAKLLVKDQGMGIALEQRERIFQRFERAGVSGRKVAGLGLGLYICRQIVQAHSGSIQVESELNVGSTFTVQLPLWLEACK